MLCCSLLCFIGVTAGLTTGCFPPTVPCGTMIDSLPGGNFQVSSSSSALGPGPEVHGFFSSKDLPTTFGSSAFANSLLDGILFNITPVNSHFFQGLLQRAGKAFSILSFRRYSRGQLPGVSSVKSLVVLLGL